MNNQQSIKVWDLAVRIFHWTLVSSFVIAYVTEDHFLSVHTLAGYLIGGLIVFRLIWGFVGTRYARFSDFVRSPSEVIDYLKDMLHFRAENTIGHNPAGGAMVVALLLSLTMTTITGLAVYGAEEMSGPLASLMATMPSFLGDVFEELHEFFANFTLLLVVLHVAGVIFATKVHGENLVAAMITGYKKIHK